MFKEHQIKIEKIEGKSITPYLQCIKIKNVTGRPNFKQNETKTYLHFRKNTC